MTAPKVMSDRFKVSRLLAKRLKEHEVSLQTVLRRAGLPAGFFEQEKICVTTAGLFALWRADAPRSSRSRGNSAQAPAPCNVALAMPT